MKPLLIALALFLVSKVSYAQVGTINQLKEDYGFNGVKFGILKSEFDSVKLFERQFKYFVYRDNNARELFKGINPLALEYQFTDDTLFSFHYEVPADQLDTLNELFVKRYGDYKVTTRGNPEKQEVYYEWQAGDISLTTYDAHPHKFARVVFSHKGKQRAFKRLNDLQLELWSKDKEKREKDFWDNEGKPLPCPTGINSLNKRAGR